MGYHEINGNPWREEELVRIHGGKRIAELRARGTADHGRLSLQAFCGKTRFPEGTLKLLEKPGTDQCKGATAVRLAEALAQMNGGDPAKEFDLFVVGEDHSGRDLSLRCRFLVPFVLPRCSRKRLLGRQARPFSFKQLCGHCVDHSDGLSLYWFPHGVGVWVLEHRSPFDSVSAYAQFRRTLYRAINKSGSHLVNRLTKEVGQGSGTVLYVLSLVELQRSPWPPAKLDNALKLLCAPSLLLPHNAAEPLDIQSCVDLERTYLAKGLSQPEFFSFGLDRILSGYASWSGVSMYVHDHVRSVSFDYLTELEVALQSAWSLIHLCKTRVDGGVSDGLLSQISLAKALAARVADVGATENVLGRLMTEAVVRTSRIETIIGELDSAANRNRAFV